MWYIKGVGLAELELLFIGSSLLLFIVEVQAKDPLYDLWKCSYKEYGLS